ncbi:hypothetical protein HKD37_16G044327 [Glycine soja]
MSEQVTLRVTGHESYQYARTKLIVQSIFSFRETLPPAALSSFFLILPRGGCASPTRATASPSFECASSILPQGSALLFFIEIMVRTRGLGRVLGQVTGRGDRDDSDDAPQRRRPTASARRQRVAVTADHIDE